MSSIGWFNEREHILTGSREKAYAYPLQERADLSSEIKALINYVRRGQMEQLSYQIP